MLELPAVRLSSRLTFFFKFVFPTVWLAGFFGSSVALWLSRDPESHAAAVPFSVATALGALFFCGVCFPIKRIIAGPQGLFVSNFFKEIEIPYSRIASIKENKWINSRITTIWVAIDTPFGQRIRFQPYTHFGLLFWRDHPAVVLLRERVRAATGTG